MKKGYTILLLPPDHSSAKTFRLPLFTKKLIGIVTGTLILLILGLVGLNLYQQRSIRQLQVDYFRLQQALGSLNERDDELADLNMKTAQTSGIAEHLDLLQQDYDAALKTQSTLNHTPSILPVAGEITSPYGYRGNPFGGSSSEFHDGVDIACNPGTPVKATADGVVTFAGWDSAYGEKVSLNHGHGIETFYGHNSKLLVAVGDNVKKGEVIAYSGSTGRSTGPHLHYGAIINGKTADPLQFTSYLKEQ